MGIGTALITLMSITFGLFLKRIRRLSHLSLLCTAIILDIGNILL